MRAATPQTTLDLVASFQQSVIDELLRHATMAADQLGLNPSSWPAASLVTPDFAHKPNAPASPVTSQLVQLSTDNAAMIAAAAYPKFLQKDFAGCDLNPQQA